MKTLALTFIAKNEEYNLIRFNYSNVFKQFDEVVVEDTGSTDNTVGFLKDHGVNYSQVPWKKDFSFHRNNAIKRVQSDYIFSVEPDVLFGDTVVPRVREIINATDEKVVINIIWANIYENGDKKNFPKLTVFPNDGTILYSHQIHETIDIAVKNSGYKIITLDNVDLHHYGYYTTEIVDNKILRNLTLLEQYYKENKSNDSTTFQLAVTYYDLQKYDFGESLFTKLTSSHSSLSCYSHLYISYIMMNRGDIDKAYSEICKATLHSNYPVSLNYRGFLEYKLNQFATAEKTFNLALKSLKGDTSTYSIPLDITKETSKSYEGLLLVLFELHKYKELIFISKKLENLTDYIASSLLVNVIKSYAQIGNNDLANRYLEILKARQ